MLVLFDIIYIENERRTKKMKTNRFYDLENCTNDCKMAIANLLKQYNINFEEHEDEKVLRKLKAWLEWILED